jgi:cytochrome o ubiquinol oxidase subunit 2
MRKNKKSSLSSIVWRIVLGLTGLSVVIAAIVHGNNVALLDSRGFVAHEQRKLLFIIVALLMVIGIPALFLAYYTAWKYRESNDNVKRSSRVKNKKILVSVIWLIPSMFALLLAMIMWPATHRLDHKSTIDSGTKPITIQVISMRWKWVFIYPEQHIATVNFVQIPEHTPINFMLTADEAPMSSFWIPNLGGQLYSMTGHSNQLNLVGDTVGDYVGSSAEINGEGFADMKFTARVSPKSAFDFWVNQVRLSGQTLDETQYQELLKPSEKTPATFYGSVNSTLYDRVLMKYGASMGGHEHMAGMGENE